jgi:triacylglycerol lipase
VLADLSPARRRFVLGSAGLALLAVLVVAVVLAARSREAPVVPAAQDEPGTVLLVPGYGGGTDALEVLAAALRDAGRVASIVDPPGDGTGDLPEQARHLAEVAERAMADDGAGSVDVVGYSAGGVVARLWVEDPAAASVVRRVVTLASPHHGSDLAALARGLVPGACSSACRQLAPDSDLLRTLNAHDETPDGPLWVTIWTTDDQTVVPPTSGRLEGALGFSVQSVCPGLTVTHADLPRTPAVVAMTLAALGTAEPAVPDGAVCRPGSQPGS